MNNINDAYRHPDVYSTLMMPADSDSIRSKILHLLKQRSLSANDLNRMLIGSSARVIVRLLHQLERNGDIIRTKTVSMDMKGNHCPVWAYVRG